MSALEDDPRHSEQPWIEVGRAYRRICLLRREGKPREALCAEESELEGAVARARRLCGSDEEADAVIATLKSREEERVAVAVAVAEVLVPILERRLPMPEPVRAEAAPHSPRHVRCAAPAPERGIADFIDDMLAQDRLAARRGI